MSQKHVHHLPKTLVPSTFEHHPPNFLSTSTVLPGTTTYPLVRKKRSKFSKNYYEQKVRLYQFPVVKELTEEHLDKTGNLDCCDEVLDDDVEGIDLQLPSDDENADNDEYYAEEDFGDLYDEEDGWVVDSQDDDDSNDGDFHGKGGNLWGDDEGEEKEEAEEDFEPDWEGDLKMGKTEQTEEAV
ncbi:hypothetical protein CROQUDRAFT_98745 [Cronartium quercuum f. sp. fusiforme G11]|uniref:Transcription factor Iwr1 domain-containing protein n=1 Tax=Cronartium quercuum f. sp. fusiforme G11 TaxID=708437 RepID=A0A9P6T726_9BASI|nr:hypothetical protein CROQUDRAFT_98745 [Cronartium quercuum f. sp. fusiforme G11]